MAKYSEIIDSYPGLKKRLDECRRAMTKIEQLVDALVKAMANVELLINFVDIPKPGFLHQLGKTIQNIETALEKARNDKD